MRLEIFMKQGERAFKSRIYGTLRIYGVFEKAKERQGHVTLKDLRG